MLVIERSVVAGGTLSIFPISSIFPSSAYQVMEVQATTVPHTQHGAMWKVDGGGSVETIWGTGAPNPFSPAVSPSFNQNRINAGNGFRYKHTGTQVGVSESIPIRFRNTLGTTTLTDTLVINVVSPVGGPQIVSQSSLLMGVVTGGTAGMSVVATGNPTLQYQWYTGYSPSTQFPINGATSSFYFTPPLQPSPIGLDYPYWCRVFNSVGSVASATFLVKVGAAPTANAGGPYNATERGSVQLTGSGTDPNNGLFLYYSWDLNNNGVFGEPFGTNGAEDVQNPLFQSAGLDGPSVHPIKLRVTNDRDISVTVNGSVNISNAPPRALLNGNGSGTINFINIVDSDADVAAMRFNFDFDSDINGTLEVTNSTSASQTIPAGAILDQYRQGRSVRGFLVDPQGASARYAATNSGPAVTVTTVVDEQNTTLTSPIIQTGVSLREAINYAQSTTGVDCITFDPALLASSNAVFNMVLEQSPGTAFAINSAVRIYGPPTGRWGVRMVGKGSGTNYRAFTVAAGVPLELRNIQLENFAARHASLARGGAIFSEGSLSLYRTTILNSTAVATGSGGVAQGGAVFANSDVSNTFLIIENSTFTGNLASAALGTSRGGAIYGRNAFVTISSSTLSANTATQNRNIHIASDGAGNGASLGLYDTIVGQTDATVSDVGIDALNGGGAASMLGNNNLIRNAGNWTPPSSNADPRLGSLATNGGTTQSLKPLTLSPAISAAAANNAINIDQRGLARPQGGAKDMGAVEALGGSAVFNVLTSQSLVYTFPIDARDEYPRTSFVLTNLTTNTTLASNVGTFTTSGDGLTMTLNLTNLLPDGRYRATVGPIRLEFFVLAGDFNRDARVGFEDLLLLAANYGQTGRTHAQGDANYNGTVNFEDLLLLAARYNTVLASSLAGGRAMSRDDDSSVNPKSVIA
jgi:hypothetical protein